MKTLLAILVFAPPAILCIMAAVKLWLLLWADTGPNDYIGKAWLIGFPLWISIVLFATYYSY